MPPAPKRQFKTLRRKPDTRTHPAVEALFVEAQRRRISMREVMERAGVGQKSHWSWRHEYTPNAAHLEAALNVVGLTLRAVPMEPRA